MSNAITKINFKPEKGDVLIVDPFMVSDEDIMELRTWFKEAYPDIKVAPIVLLSGIVGRVKATGIDAFLEKANEMNRRELNKKEIREGKSEDKKNENAKKLKK